ncbi:hypothetical protein LZ31DRAFT_312245 [Colletotrichum somersetense]|nr:hypothetical protein LZ31DRAFT_312245 [Colletotrichum somersetense]
MRCQSSAVRGSQCNNSSSRSYLLLLGRGRLKRRGGVSVMPGAMGDAEWPASHPWPSKRPRVMASQDRDGITLSPLPPLPSPKATAQSRAFWSSRWARCILLAMQTSTVIPDHPAYGGIAAQDGCALPTPRDWSMLHRAGYIQSHRSRPSQRRMRWDPKLDDRSPKPEPRRPYPRWLTSKGAIADITEAFYPSAQSVGACRRGYMSLVTELRRPRGYKQTGEKKRRESHLRR